MKHEEFEEEEEEEIDLESIEDEKTLIDMLDDTEDIDERKRIRDRLRQVQFVIKAQREEARLRRENEREQKLRNKVKEADLHKKKTLAMYDEMAKMGPPGSKKQSDSQLSGGRNTKDLVEQTIRERQKACDDRKKRIMAAFDHAAKSQPAGGARIVEFDAFKRADVSKMETNTPSKGSSTFSMSGGISRSEKASPSVPKTPVPEDDSHLDPMERAIRARVREADERKRRTLAAYDVVARSGGAGPKVIIMEEFKNMDVSSATKKGPRYDPCFRGGLKT